MQRHNQWFTVFFQQLTYNTLLLQSLHICQYKKKKKTADPVSFNSGQIFTTHGTSVMPLSTAAVMRVLLHRKSASTRNLGTQFSYAVKLTLCPRSISRSSIFLTYAGLLCGKALMIRDTIKWTLCISLRIILILFLHLCLCQKLSLLFRSPY